MPEAYFSELFNGQSTSHDVLQPIGEIQMFMIPDGIKNFQGVFFIIKDDHYYFESGLSKDSLYMIRNNDKIVYPLNRENQKNDVMFQLTWSPDKLKLLILDESFRDFVKSIPSIDDLDAKAIAEIEKRTKYVDTTITYPPNSLIKWLREQNIIPKSTYDSIIDLNSQVINSIQSIYDTIQHTSMFEAFWDIEKEGHHIVKRRPKDEPQIKKTIHGLLMNIAIAKNFEISSEFLLGGGNLDFLITGILKDKCLANICVEFKHAHNQDLEHGLTEQLPKYMRDKGCDFGIYVVLLFKGEFFDKPTLDRNSLELRLNLLRDKNNLNGIRILYLDLSKPKSPSVPRI